ncbi:hypothetical protein AALA69_05805 [Eggerthellaceae bacterium 24-137]
MKARNLALTIIACALMLAPGTLWMLSRAHVELPSWLTAENASYLSGGIEESHLSKTISLSGFMSEKLQKALDTELDNNIPCRAEVLLGNASLQRSAISLSNALFQFEAYPTFYGSGTIYIPETDSLATMPTTNSKLRDDSIETVASIASIANEYPAKNFYLIVADMSDTSLANPASHLVTGAIHTDDFLTAMNEVTENLPNVHVVSIPYDNPKDYYRNYYRSDHHWNGFGTLELYDSVASKARLPYHPDITSIPSVDFGGFLTNGSYARDGLTLINEPACEPQFDLSNLKVQNEEIPAIAMADSVIDMEDRGLMAEFNFYTQWYGSSLLTHQSPLINTAAPSGKRAVVIMDSFADSLHWLLAKNYSYLRCYRDIRVGSKGEESLVDRIAEAEADDIYFIGSAIAYAHIPKGFPNYFEK